MYKKIRHCFQNLHSIIIGWRPKTSRQSKKTARQGLVNIDEINLEELAREEQDDTNDDAKKKPIPKKRTGPRIKNTKDKKEKKKAKALAAAAAQAARKSKKG